MVTVRKPGVGVDAHLLNRAAQANSNASHIVASIADSAAQDRRIAGSMMRLSLLLGQQAMDLAEMRIIRRMSGERE